MKPELLTRKGQKNTAGVWPGNAVGGQGERGGGGSQKRTKNKVTKGQERFICTTVFGAVGGVRGGGAEPGETWDKGKKHPPKKKFDDGGKPRSHKTDGA